MGLRNNVLSIHDDVNFVCQIFGEKLFLQYLQNQFMNLYKINSNFLC